MNDRPLPSAGPAAARSNDPTRPQGVSLEVPVTLQGLPGPGGNQAFYEETRTVLVMAQGAVVRLGAEVMPGQKLVLTNPRTKQEALARVVHSRSHPNTKGYAEVEFAQPAPGYWGMSFPSEPSSRVANQPPAAPPVSPVQPAGEAATLHESRPKPFIVSQTKPSPVTQDPAPMLASAPAIRPPVPAAPSQAPPAPLNYESVSVVREVIPLADLAKREVAATPAPATASLHTPGAPASGTQKPAGSFGPKTTTEVVTLRLPQLGESARLGESRSRPRAWIFIALAAVVLAGSAAFFLYNSSSTANADRTALESAGQPTTTPVTDASQTAAPANPAPVVESSAPSGSSVAPAAAPPSPAPSVAPATAQRTTSAPPSSVSAPAETPQAASAKPERRPAPKLTLSAPIVGVSKVGPAAAEPAPNVVPEPAPTLAVTAPALPMALSNAGTPPPPAAPAPRVGGRVQSAKLISSPPPTYPSVARAQRLQGEVVLDASIDANGHVTEVSVVSGPAMLQQAAIDAVRRWRYEPALLNGQPVPTQAQVRVHFRP